MFPRSVKILLNIFLILYFYWVPLGYVQMVESTCVLYLVWQYRRQNLLMSSLQGEKGGCRMMLTLSEMQNTGGNVVGVGFNRHNRVLDIIWQYLLDLKIEVMHGWLNLPHWSFLESLWPEVKAYGHLLYKYLLKLLVGFTITQGDLSIKKRSMN